jgi:hypothetical protein
MNWIRSFDDVGMTDVVSVGGKNAPLRIDAAGADAAWGSDARRIRHNRRRLQNLQRGSTT